jgi:hypothetical protein
VDTDALAAALAGAEDGSVAGAPWLRLELEQRLREREQELAAAPARITGLEDALQAQVQGGDEG